MSIFWAFIVFMFGALMQIPIYLELRAIRKSFGALLVEEVSNTVDTPDAVEPELRHLLAALSD